MISPVSAIAAGECCAQAVTGRAGCHLGQLARGRLPSICNHRWQQRLHDPFAMPVVQDRHGEAGLVAVAAADGVNGPDGRLSRRFNVDSAPRNVI